jgi:hypothetical protein
VAGKTPPKIEEKKTERTENPPPLWLPEGSVRAIIALSLIGVLSYLAITETIQPDRLIEIVMVIIGFYFGSRKTTTT